MSGTVFQTGFEDLDKALGELEPSVQKKYGKRAMNNALKIVEKSYKELVPVDTGAMRDAIIRRVPKGTKRGQMRRALTITRESLARQMAKIEDVDIDQVKFRGFYPAFVELGTSTDSPKRPMRDALYGNESMVRAEFIVQLRKIITDQQHSKEK